MDLLFRGGRSTEDPPHRTLDMRSSVTTTLIEIHALLGHQVMFALGNFAERELQVFSCFASKQPKVHIKFRQQSGVNCFSRYIWVANSLFWSAVSCPVNCQTWQIQSLVLQQRSFAESCALSGECEWLRSLITRKPNGPWFTVTLTRLFIVKDPLPPELTHTLIHKTNGFNTWN